MTKHGMGHPFDTGYSASLTCRKGRNLNAGLNLLVLQWTGPSLPEELVVVQADFHCRKVWPHIRTTAVIWRVGTTLHVTLLLEIWSFVSENEMGNEIGQCVTPKCSTRWST